MKTYIVKAWESIERSIEIEAEDENKAIEEAQCTVSGWDSKPCDGWDHWEAEEKKGA